MVKQALVTAYQNWQEGKTYENDKGPVKEQVRRAQAANHRDFLCSVGGVIFLGTWSDSQRVDMPFASPAASHRSPVCA